MSHARRDAWSGSARQYDAFEKRWHFYGTVADELVSHLAVREDSRVLELASGTGVCALKLAKIVRTGRIVGVDFSEGMIGVAKENAAAAGVSNVEFIQGDACDVSRLLNGEEFDFAVCNSAFWQFPEPEKVLEGIDGLLTGTGEFALSLPSWVGRNEEARDAFRAKAREILLKHGVSPEELGRILAERPSRRSGDLLELFNRCGFFVRESPFEFAVTQESRDDWRGISVFAGIGRMGWSFPGIGPAAQREVREELDEWRRADFPRDPLTSRWRMLVAYRSQRTKPDST